MGHKIHTQKHIDEGLIKGKKVYLFLILPSIFIFLLALMAWLAVVLYANKFIVNGNNPEICKLIRKQYRTTIKNDYPCEVSEKDGSFLATFTLNPNDVNNAPSMMSFKVDKNTKQITPAISR